MTAFWNARKIVWALAVILLAGATAFRAAIAHANRGEYRFAHHLAQPPVPGMKELPVFATGEELAEFETHLPVVVLEFTDGEPKRHMKWEPNEQRLVPVAEDPFASGHFRLYHNEDSPNRLSDKPAVETPIRSRLRGGSSLNFSKTQYLVKMVNEDGGQNRLDLLGMGADWEWILNVSYIDKSLLRNYMAYALAGAIMDYAPEARYCEVFFKRADQYEYLGVYLITESIKRGRDRLPLTKYDPHHAASSFIVRRDRFDPTSLMLDTHAGIRGLSENVLSLRYPGKKKVTPRTIAYVEGEISRFEEALYSSDPAVFATYREMVDLDTFADYFIINEFFGNYDSQMHSLYSYKDIEGKLRMGPVWDFDQCLGNSGSSREYSAETINMQYGQWFDRVSKDGKFVQMVKDRYAELRQDREAARDQASAAAGLLSEQFVEKFIDDVVAYLGDARVRDWNRWRYDDHSSLGRREVRHPALMNNTRNYEEEIARIKEMLRRHGAAIDKNLDKLYEKRTIE